MLHILRRRAESERRLRAPRDLGAAHHAVAVAVQFLDQPRQFLDLLASVTNRLTDHWIRVVKKGAQYPE